MANPNWKKGMSGNPKGRPKKAATLTEILEDLGKVKDVSNGKGDTIARKEALAAKLWQMAIKGDLGAIKYIFDRIDGKPEITEHIDATVHGGVLRVPEFPTTDEDWERGSNKTPS